jgi:hypothetical protein
VRPGCNCHVKHQADYIVSIERGSVKRADFRPLIDLNKAVSSTPVIEVKQDDDETDIILRSIRGSRLVTDEVRLHGSVKLSVYFLYANAACGLIFIIMVCLSNAAFQLSMLADDWWLKVHNDQP